MIYFALLVHSNRQASLTSQIANLRRHHKSCRIGLYLASDGQEAPFGGDGPDGVEICPLRPPMEPVQHTRFLYDMMTWLTEKGERYDYLVALDSQVMFVKKGYEDDLHRQMSHCDYLFSEPFQAVQVYTKEQVDRLLTCVGESSACDLDTPRPDVSLKERLFSTLLVAAGGTYRTVPAWPEGKSSEAMTAPQTAQGAQPAQSPQPVQLPQPLRVSQVLAAQKEPDVYWIWPVADDPLDAARAWLGDVAPNRPRTLTVMWGCYQGGMEAALQNRLRKLGEWGMPAHAYFYVGGAGLPNFRGIPYVFSPNKDDLGNYLQAHVFDCVTFVNTLYNFEQLERVEYQGHVFFELHGYEEGVVRELRRINERGEGGRIEAILVPSNHVAELARSYLPDRPDLPVVVVRNTLDTNLFRKRSGTDWVISHYPELAPWAKCPLLGWVGRLDANKNWPLLLNIFRSVKNKQKEAKLLIASDLTSCPDLKDFYRRLFEYGLFEDCHILGNLPYPKMPHYYSMIAKSGGVLLSTSRSEGYPYHLLEAQACECPVVCTEIGGSLEIIEQGVNGFTYPLEQERYAAQWVLLLFKNRELRKQLAARGRARLLQHNDIERNVVQYAAWLSKKASPEKPGML